jgi:pimeloyl-ACP methyl ester carboxylesterase
VNRGQALHREARRLGNRPSSDAAPLGLHFRRRDRIDGVRKVGLGKTSWQRAGTFASDNMGMATATHESAGRTKGGVRWGNTDFESRGERCAAWLGRPTWAERPPLVVMAHGFAAERTFGLLAFAERFAELGCAVMLFDYRCFGNSEGQPRNWVSPRRHNQDWDRAIDHSRSLQGIDRERIVLWGSSFSGGHVIATASRRSDINAIIAQVPFVDGRASVSKIPLPQMLRLAGAGLRDGLRMLIGRPPHCVPVVGRPGEFAIMNTPECEPGYRALIPEGSRWENEVPARIILTVGTYRPIRAAWKVRSPALIVLAEKDSLIPAEAVERTAARIPDCRLERLACNHFEPYQGEWFEKNIALQELFLRERVL